MTSPMSVDGLVSGLNTTQIISQLMQVEAAPQNMLKGKVSTESTIISAYQAINSKFAALQTAAEAFTAPNALTPTNPTWQLAKATSSVSSVTATATTGATPGSYTFNVTQLAQAQSTTADVTASAGGAVTTGSGIDITIGGTTNHVTVGTDTAQGVADAINAAKVGVAASVVTTSTGQTMLQFTGTSTGAANAFTIAGLQAATTNITTAQDAQVTVGTVGSGGYTVSNSTNTLANVIPNVTLNVSQVVSGVTVTVSNDADAIADKMQALVDAANGALAQISLATGYDPGSKKGSPLTGDFTVRELQSNVLSAVSSGQSGYGSYKQFGVQLSSDGKLTFDRTAFLNAYAANPSAVQNAVATGFAQSMDNIAKAATDPLTGSLTAAITGGNAELKTLNDEIADWDTRLQLRQQTLQRQFTALETALGSMKNQSNWLAGQIASLPTASG
jgi:flagellar hook-associated protein 2